MESIVICVRVIGVLAGSQHQGELEGPYLLASFTLDLFNRACISAQAIPDEQFEMKSILESVQQAHSDACGHQAAG